MTIWRKRSQSASVFCSMKSNSLASDHQTLRYAAEAGDHVAQVAVVGLGRHAVEAPVAPLVVGVEQDQVGLDAQVAELADALLEVAEERGVEPGVVPLVRRRAVERVQRRLVRGCTRSAWGRCTCAAC